MISPILLPFKQKSKTIPPQKKELPSIALYDRTFCRFRQGPSASFWRKYSKFLNLFTKYSARGLEIFIKIGYTGRNYKSSHPMILKNVSEIKNSHPQ
ncbi:MAG: hypothetical protein K6C40_12615, partial [Thermoguttaceae bacterium]|nr:hypothetical protein [Thermoguttaceae bacterium]